MSSHPFFHFATNGGWEGTAFLTRSPWLEFFFVRCATISELLFADGVCDRRSHPAEEVYVTGTFDGWGKSQQLEKVGDVFEKKVKLLDPADKIFYKVCNTPSFLLDPSAAGTLGAGISRGRLLSPTSDEG